MNFDFATIKSDLERLRLNKELRKIFGADSHQFILNPPLPEALVLNFEEHYQISLPSDYRYFLTELGNGGAGPYYGVFRLGEMDSNFEYTKWQENDGFVGWLAKPFPFSSPWNDLTDYPSSDDENEVENERALEDFERKYWSSENMNGAIPICHFGCALRCWLIVTGSEAGNIWCDERADFKGLYPLSSKDKTRVTFYEWYRDWLNNAIWQCKR